LTVESVGIRFDFAIVSSRLVQQFISCNALEPIKATLWCLTTLIQVQIKTIVTWLAKPQLTHKSGVNQLCVVPLVTCF